METNKPNNKKAWLIVVVLAIVLTGCICLAAYQKGLIGNQKEESQQEKTDKKEEQKEEKQEETKETTEEIAEDATFTKKVQSMTEAFADYLPITDLSIISNQDLLFFALRQIGWKETIPASDVENVIKEHFGNEIKVNHENIECFVANHDDLYIYENGEYRQNPDHGGHGGPGSVMTYVRYISGSKKGNTVELNYKVLYSNFCGDTCVLYQYFTRSGDEGSKVIDFTNAEGSILTDEKFDEVSDQVPITTFTYEVTDDGVYNLKSIKISD